MAFKVNPISFRLGITRCWKTTNNICSSNYSYSFFNYYRYEQVLFNFFYKHKFWVISSKLINLSPFLLLIFCNFYKLNLNYRSLPIRKRRRKIRPDLDCIPIKRNWKHYFDKIYFTKSKIKSNIRKDFKGLYSKYLKKKKLIRKYNRIRKLILKKKKNIWKKSKKKLKIKNKNKKIKKKNSIKLIKKIKKVKKVKKIKKIKKVKNEKWKKLKKILKKIKKKKSKKNILKKLLKINFSNIYFLPIKLNYNLKKLKFYKYNFFNKNNISKQNDITLLTKIKKSLLNNFVLSQSKKKIQKWNEHSFLNPKWESYAIKNFHIREKLFFYFLQKNLKYLLKNKNIILKLRNINTLLYENSNFNEWEDVLRTAYLTERRRKYFVRTVFKDFFFMHRIAYIERDAQLFANILVSFFEVTRFHRNLLFLLKSVLHIFKKRYDYILNKIKLKGRMQNRKRTKKVYLLRDSIPLNRLYKENTEISYGQSTAVTFVGALNIKIWLYFLQS